MNNNFGMYLILLRNDEVDDKSILDFFMKAIEDDSNKLEGGKYKSVPDIKGIIFDMINILKNNKKKIYTSLKNEIKKRQLDVMIDPYTNNLYDSINRSKNKDNYPLLELLIKEKILTEEARKVFMNLRKGERNKEIKLALSLDNYFLYNFLKLQKENDITKYVIPYIPLDPATYRPSILKNIDMLKSSQDYLSKVLAIKDNKIIPVICVTKNMIYYVYGRLDKNGKNIIRRLEWSQMLEAYREFNFEDLIIKIDNFNQYERDTTDFEAIRYFFIEVKKLFSNVKIIFSDFNEFSYKLTLDGLENYSTTICKSLSRSGGNNIPTAEQKLGKYYVEPDVEYYLINQIGNKLDDCFFCRLIHKTPLGKNIDKNLWKYVRLGHFIIAKNNESNKINKAKNKGQLKEGVHDMFANSKNLKSLA